MNLEELKKPFPARKIRWRVGATNAKKTQGLALAYIDARTVMERLDRVVGPENWQKEYNFGNNGEIICRLSIKVNDNWISKEGGAGQTDIESIKGGLSNSFKRAAVNFGIARYLYNLPNIWVPIEKQGKQYVIKQTPKLPEKFLPETEKKKKINNEAKRYISEIRNIYQSQPEAIKQVILNFLESKGEPRELSEVGKLNVNQAEKLAKKLKKIG